MVNLADNSVEPVFDIGISEIDLFVHLDGLVVELLRGLNLDMELMNLGVRGATTFDFNVWLLVLHLKLVKLFSDLLVLMSQHVQLLLVVADSLQQLRVCGFSREEFLNDLLHIRETCLSANLLESLLDLCGSGHLFVHLGLEEGAPELLCEEVLVHLELVGVLVVIGSLVTDLLLSSVSLDTSLERSLLVIERFEN